MRWRWRWRGGSECGSWGAWRVGGHWRRWDRRRGWLHKVLSALFSGIDNHTSKPVSALYRFHFGYVAPYSVDWYTVPTFCARVKHNMQWYATTLRHMFVWWWWKYNILDVPSVSIFGLTSLHNIYNHNKAEQKSGCYHCNYTQLIEELLWGMPTCISATLLTQNTTPRKGLSFGLEPSSRT